MKLSTFGNGDRNFSNLPKDIPGPGKYFPVQFTEASHSFTFPKTGLDGDVMNKAKVHSPDPFSYNNMKGMAGQLHLAKSILGGSKDQKADKVNNFPGPAQYSNFPTPAIPGFVIALPQGKSLKEVGKVKDPVGPQKYNPVNPNHHRTDGKDKPITTFGTAIRGELISGQNMNVGPGQYVIEGDFDKPKEKAKFHMGIKT